MDDHTYKLINMLERAPRDSKRFGGFKKRIVMPAYLLEDDVDRIIRLLKADFAASPEQDGRS